MIDKYWGRSDVPVPLVLPDQLISKVNIFSILVGKNGTGKSTLLGALVQDIVRERNNNEKIGVPSTQTIIGYFPKRIIAVSISPFDKFPIYRVPQKTNYTYLGLRDLNGSNYSLAYLSKIIAFLIECVSNEKSQAYEIGSVLDYLGYRDEMVIRFQTLTSRTQFEEIAHMDDIEYIHTITDVGRLRGLNREFLHDSNASVDREKAYHLKAMINKILYGDKFSMKFEISFSNKGLSVNEEDADDLLFLLHSGILRLKDVILFTKKEGKNFSIKNASSGEQSIILSVLGIASYIKDNSLICIDEPEICLHPQWQEKFIEILTHTFKRYNDCHFIIATHSPIIVSRLPDVNSFIVDMESNSVKNARDLINNSSDFQLVNVFNFPGFKNEYLSRIALNIFSKVSRMKSFDQDDFENFKLIERQIIFLKDDDPVQDLYLTLKQLLNIYG